MLIGRIREQQIITDAILKRKNLFVYGTSGVGKTSMVRHIVGSLKEQNIYYSENCSSLKSALLGLLRHRHKASFLARQNTLSLKKLFYRMVKDEQFYFVFDHVARVVPKFYSFLGYLIDEEIPLMIVSRGLGRKEIGHLVMSSFNFEKVEMFNLDRTTTNSLVDHFISEFSIKITRDAEFKKEVFRFSRGNPRTIKELCSLARDAKYQKDGCLDVKLMDLDLRINEIMR